MQIDLPESTEGDRGCFQHFPVMYQQGRGGKLSFLQYDQLFARTTEPESDASGKETKAADTMTDGDMGLICSDVQAGGVVSLALIFAMNRRLLARSVFRSIRTRVTWPSPDAATIPDHS